MEVGACVWNMIKRGRQSLYVFVKHYFKLLLVGPAKSCLIHKRSIKQSLHSSKSIAPKAILHTSPASRFHVTKASHQSLPPSCCKVGKKKKNQCRNLFFLPPPIRN